VRRLDPIREDGKSQSSAIAALADIFGGDDPNDDFRPAAPSRNESGWRGAKERRAGRLTLSYATRLPALLVENAACGADRGIDVPNRPIAPTLRVSIVLFARDVCARLV
jgi:hypothetical protein